MSDNHSAWRAHLPEGGPLFCLEVANNHQGRLDHGRRLLDVIASTVADLGVRVAVKFQLRELDTFLHEADRAQYGTEPLSKHSIRFKETRLQEREMSQLVQHARGLGLRPYATPFDEASVDECVNYGFDLIKVASCSAYDWPLLERIAAARKPVICSIGGLSRNEVDDVVEYFARAECPLALLHCVAAYPTEVADLQLDQIRQLQVRYPHVPVGYSGHERPADVFVVGLAIAKGARLLERHVGLPTDQVSLNAYSLDPAQLRRWTEAAMQASAACANESPRRDVQGERASLQSLRRGIYARRTIPAGKTLTRDDVVLAMPCLDGQFHAGKLDELIGSFTPIEPIYANLPVGLEPPATLPKALILASIVARVREMLREARVELDNCTLELSHQHGFDRFFEHGAVIIDVVNRDYCKKLIVQFPGQQHPAHRHLKKEETFQVLSGSVTLVLDGRERTLHAGETQLVERGSMHSFRSATGVIFEEISTTHIKGDSVYEDASIASDPSGRKTPLGVI
jgi:N-acetylneuraminate synthase